MKGIWGMGERGNSEMGGSFDCEARVPHLTSITLDSTSLADAGMSVLSEIPYRHSNEDES